jgi:iron complex outermembrane receptor protein
MQRSKKRKLRRAPKFRVIRHGIPIASTLLAAMSPVMGQERTPEGGLTEIIVTAQKREENLQNVPISVLAFDTRKLEELRVADFEDYAKFIPSVSYQQTSPGFARIFMRGVSSGDNGNHSGPLPTVGMYLDEQPVTTIQGPLDIHIYDIARVESLAGPQGTLYGASSQAGTIRIITNKPDPTAFSAAYDFQGNTVAHGKSGYSAEGFANIPLNDSMAFRVVGWHEHDAGFIDNVYGTRTYPTLNAATDGNGTVNNATVAKNNYNDVDTSGGRAALRIDLNDNWAVTTTLMGQDQQTNGFFGADTALGKLKVTHFSPETTKDKWMQAALTVEGKVGNFDIVYAGAYLHRKDQTQSDYSDYSFAYDTLYFGSTFPFGEYFFNNAGDVINPAQYLQGADDYKKLSQELRISSPQDQRLRYIAGLFWQRQTHEIEQRYLVKDLATSLEVTGWPDTLWLTAQERTDEDAAVFGEVTYDLTEKLSATGGLRYFQFKNSLKGFFGFGVNTPLSGSTGEKSCAGTPTPGGGINGGPCINLDKNIDDTDSTYKLNLTYRIDQERLVYATWATGYRPGGVNRRTTCGPTAAPDCVDQFPPYKADFLDSFEIGWKTTLADGRIRFNGAAFWQKWDNFQFSFLGANGLTNVKNAEGGATIPGIEANVEWAATDNLTVSGGAMQLWPKLNGGFCEDSTVSLADCPPEAFAPDGTTLPGTPKFKANLITRYDYDVGGIRGALQASVVYQDASRPALLPSDTALLGGNLAGYAIADLSATAKLSSWDVELYVDNVFDEQADTYKFAQCDESKCAAYSSTYAIPNQPRTIGIKVGQKF